VLILNSKDGVERINVLKPKEKDLQSWKKSMPWNNRLSSEEEIELEKNGVYQKSVCPDCGKEEKNSWKVMPGAKPLDYYCLDCVKKQEEKAEEERIVKAEEKRLAEIEDRQIKYMIEMPPRYADLNESTNEKLINADCSIMYGGFGTGKTWEAYSLIKKLYCNLYIKSYKLITEAGLINYLKAGFNNNSFEDRINSLKETDLLVVDEMGKSNDSDFNKAQLFEILNYRYDWMKKTVLICNCLEKSELVDILNPAITDRFRECIIEMKGQSKRYK